MIPESGRSPGGGNGNPLQYSGLENPMDRGAWRTTVHGVAQSGARLSDSHFTSSLGQRASHHVTGSSRLSLALLCPPTLESLTDPSDSTLPGPTRPHGLCFPSLP